jgi:predicted N-acetyltransferase YhbS
MLARRSTAAAMTAPVSIRRLEEADIPTVDVVLRAAFARPTSFAAHVRLTRAIQPDGLLVAEDRGEIVGSVGAVDYGSLAYVGLMAVAPAWQGRGIGRRLMERLLGWLDERGCPTVLLDATDRGARLYEALGFVDAGEALVFERDQWSAAAATEWEAYQLRCDKAGSRGGEFCLAIAGGTRLETVARQARRDELDAIAAFDAPAFGADRRRLLAALWREHWRRCLVVREGSGELTGYLLAREPVLGPWLAATPQAAELLLTLALCMPYDLPYSSAPLVMVPRSHQRACELLVRRGFSQRRRLRHMRRGVPARGMPERLFGQSSFAHG